MPARWPAEHIENQALAVYRSVTLRARKTSRGASKADPVKLGVILLQGIADSRPESGGFYYKSPFRSCA